MAARNPTISIGMPTYNGEQWLTETIESILNQTFEDFELIISDNGSTDGTGDICKRFAAADSRVKYVQQPENIGASANYCFVFEAASAPYFKWASSNDLCHEAFLEKCLAELQARPDLALCSPRTRLFSDNPDNGHDYPDDLELLADIPCERFRQTMLGLQLNNVMNGVIRSDILAKTSLVKPYHSSDMVLMAELSLYGKFAQIPEYMYFRRMDEETSTSLMSEEKVREHYDPQKKSMMLFQTWRLHMEYIRVALRTPLPLLERLCVLRMALRGAVWSRSDLATDIWQAFRVVGSRCLGAAAR